jgi:hypothetical protein
MGRYFSPKKLQVVFSKMRKNYSIRENLASAQAE